jgi:hypothetical protein
LVINLSRKLFLLPLAVLAGCATAPPAEAPPTVEDVAAVEVTTPAPVAPAPPQEPDRRSQRISIASVGDMMLGTDFPENHLPDDDGVSFLAAVTPALSSADLTFGNLEGVLVDGGEPAKKCSNPSACYLFRSPTRYAEYYRAAGFDVYSMPWVFITPAAKETLPAWL